MFSLDITELLNNNRTIIEAIHFSSFLPLIHQFVSFWKWKLWKHHIWREIQIYYRPRNLQWNLCNCEILYVWKKDLQVPEIADDVQEGWNFVLSPYLFIPVCCHPRPVIVFLNISKRVASILKGFTWKFEFCLMLVRWRGRFDNLAQVLVLWFICSIQSSTMILDSILVYWNFIISWHGSNQIITTGLLSCLALYTCSFFRK